MFLKFYISHSDSLIQLSSQFIMSGWGTGYSFHCDLVNYSESPQALRVCLPHIYMYCKIMLCTYVTSYLHLSYSPVDGSNLLDLLFLKVH